VAAEPFWLSRLRWRLRGAWQWPAYFGLTAFDALLLHLMPPLATGVRFVPALILASFLNLFLMGVIAPRVARRLRRRQAPAQRVPQEITLDRARAGALAVGTVAVLVLGLLSRPDVASEAQAREANQAAVRDFVVAHGDSEARRHLDSADTLRLGPGYFRTCVASDEPHRAFCFFVDTSVRPAELREDPNTLPNRDLLGASQGP